MSREALASTIVFFDEIVYDAVGAIQSRNACELRLAVAEPTR